MTRPEISFSAYLKPLWTRSFAPSADSVRARWLIRRHAAEKVGLRWIWLLTYLRRPVALCMSLRFWTAFSPSSASPWTAKVWSLPSPGKWRAMTGFCARKRTPSRCARRCDEPALRVPRHCRRLAQRLSPTTHLPARHTPGSWLSGMHGPPLSFPHHLDQWRPEPQLERGILPPFTPPVGAAAFVSADSAEGLVLLPAASGRRGPRRYPAEENRTVDCTGVLSARSFIAAVSCQSDAGSALPAGLAAGAASS